MKHNCTQIKTGIVNIAWEQECFYFNNFACSLHKFSFPVLLAPGYGHTVPGEVAPVASEVMLPQDIVFPSLDTPTAEPLTNSKRSLKGFSAALFYLA